MDIREFLTTRLDEDEAAAKAAHASPWVADLDDPTDENVTDVTGQIVAWVRARPATAQTMAHIARHDPARVLAEVAAKRKIAAEYQSLLHHREQYSESAEGWGARTKLTYVLQLLAAPYADHPDYDPAWSVE